MYKNIDADYYGLCHYRRYFNYNTKKQRPPRVACCWITDHLTQKYFWNKTAIKDVIANYDILLACAEPGAAKPGVKSIWDFNMEVGNEQHYSLLMRCIQEYSPEYYPFAKRYFNGTNEHMFNMFIMKKSCFVDYSKWLFGLLDMVENELALKHILIDRSCGYFGEHLLNIFALYQQEENKKRIGSLQTVMILSTSDDLPLNEKIKAVFKKIFTIFFPYGSQRRDMIKWIFVMKG